MRRRPTSLHHSLHATLPQSKGDIYAEFNSPYSRVNSHRIGPVGQRRSVLLNREIPLFRIPMFNGRMREVQTSGAMI